MVWTPGGSGSKKSQAFYDKAVKDYAAQKQDTSQQDTSAAGITADLDKLLADAQQTNLEEQLNQIVASKGKKGSETYGVDPLTPWGKRTGKYNYIRDKFLKYGFKGLTEGEKTKATHYLGLTGGAGTVPTPYSGQMDRFMKTSPAHAKAYKDKFGFEGALNYFMGTAPEAMLENTLIGQMISKGLGTGRNIAKGIWNVVDKPVKEFGTMVTDIPKFLAKFGKPHDAKIMEINEEAKLPLNEAIKEQNIKSGVTSDEEMKELWSKAQTLGQLKDTLSEEQYNEIFGDGTEDIIDTESIAYKPGKNLQVQNQYPQLQQELDQLSAPYGDPLFHRDAQGNLIDPWRNWEAADRDQTLYNMPWDETLSPTSIGLHRDWRRSAGAPYETGANIDWPTPLQKKVQDQQEEINELKKTIVNNPVLDTGTSSNFDLDTFLDTYSSNPYKDYSGVIRKNLPFEQPWTNVDPNEFQPGGKYHTESIFDSEAYENLSEDQKKALGTIDWGGSLLNNYADGGYAKMSTYEKLKRIADGIADSE